MKFNRIALLSGVAGLVMGGVALAQTIYPQKTTLAGTELIQLVTNTANNIWVTTAYLKAYVLGTATTSTVGFYGATAVTQPSASAQKAVTDNSGGTASSTGGVASTLAVSLLKLSPGTLSSEPNNTVFLIDPGFNGKITGVNWRTETTIAGTNGAIAFTPFVNTSATTLTGGVLNLYTANASTSGSLVAGSAVTASNTFTSVQPIGVVVSSTVSTFSAGSGAIEFTVVNTDLANAIATEVAQGNAIRSALVTLGLIKGQ